MAAGSSWANTIWTQKEYNAFTGTFFARLYSCSRQAADTFVTSSIAPHFSTG